MAKDKFFIMIERILTLINRIRIKLYLLFHPYLWNHEIQLNGVPEVLYPEKLSLGKHVSLNEDCSINCVGKVVIGDRVTISRGATLLTSGLATENYDVIVKEKYRKHVSAPIIIHEGVWICANVIITPGVTIAPNCIIGAGSVVTKSLDKPSSLYAGVPARYVKSLS